MALGSTSASGVRVSAAAPTTVRRGSETRTLVFRVGLFCRRVSACDAVSGMAGQSVKAGWRAEGAPRQGGETVDLYEPTVYLTRRVLSGG